MTSSDWQSQIFQQKKKKKKNGSLNFSQVDHNETQN